MDHQIAPAFPYRELIGPDIRMLRVRPGEPGSPIECWLYQVPLSGDLEYNALSYNWGNPDVRLPITLNGHIMGITLNLYDALDRLRSSIAGFTEKYLWVDAICIDQADIREKERQIPRMAEIFRLATSVLGWLGPLDSSEDSDVELIFAGAARFGKSLEALDGFPCKALWQFNQLRYQWAHATSIPHGFASFLQRVRPTLEALVGRPWFERVWIVQETCLPQYAPILCVGRHSIESRSLYGLCKALGASSLEFSCRCSPFVDLMETRDRYRLFIEPRAAQLGKPSYVLLQILLTKFPAEAADLRDHVYGYLGLCNFGDYGGVPDSLRPDYRKQFQRVWYDAAVHLMTETGDLRILSCVGPRISGLPSWVPDLRWLMQVSRFEPFVDINSIRLSGDGTELSVKGVPLGVCEAVIPDAAGPVVGQRIDDWLRDRVNIVEDAFASVSSASQSGDIDILRWYEVLFGTDAQESRLHYANARVLYEEIRKERGGCRVENTSVDSWDDNTRSEAVHTLSMVLMNGFVINSNCNIAKTGPSRLPWRGDFICLFLGSLTPSIIRSCGTKYELVDSCIFGFGGDEDQQASSQLFWDRQTLEEFILV
ncbi:hypothetical protein DL769_007904 [Monosporascus sp. CRB-8-3]|nr:hypothetical protein DL769_007904 [Monosporascus sp. CRB-8-3]